MEKELIKEMIESVKHHIELTDDAMEKQFYRGELQGFTYALQAIEYGEKLKEKKDESV